MLGSDSLLTMDDDMMLRLQTTLSSDRDSVRSRKIAWFHHRMSESDIYRAVAVAGLAGREKNYIQQTNGILTNLGRYEQVETNG